MSQADDFIKRQKEKRGSIASTVSTDQRKDDSIPSSRVISSEFTQTTGQVTFSQAPQQTSPDQELQQNQAAVHNQQERKNIIDGIIGLVILIIVIICMANGINKILGISIGILAFATWKGISGK